MNLDQKIISAISENNSPHTINKEPSTYLSLFLSKVTPDLENARFLPAVGIEDKHAYQFVKRIINKSDLIEIYNARNKVLVGKGCFINCLERNTSDWTRAQKNIESVIALSENLKTSEVIHVPSVISLGDGSYQVLTGHRRYYALIYVLGLDGVSHFKVYNKVPVLIRTKQFQENFSREDLNQHGKITAFNNAMLELDTMSTALARTGKTPLTVKDKANYLGISMGSYDNYNVLARYPAVLNAYELGNHLSLKKMKGVVMDIETGYKQARNLTILNVDHKKEINTKIENYLLDGKPKNKSTEIFHKLSISPTALKKMLKADVFGLDVGIDWDKVDWEDKNVVEEKVNQIIDFLENH